MKKDEKWFLEAVRAKPPYKLGWKKTQSEDVRRAKALASRPKNWKLRTRRRSVAQTLMALSDVTQDEETKRKAKRDAEYFYRLLKKK